MIDLSLVNMVFLSRWPTWSFSRSLAPMVFLSLTGSHGLPLALAPMVFLSLSGSHGLPLAHCPPWSSSVEARTFPAPTSDVEPAHSRYECRRSDDWR